MTTTEKVKLSNRVVKAAKGDCFIISVSLADKDSNPQGEGSGLVTVDGRLYEVSAGLYNVSELGDNLIDGKWTFDWNQEDAVGPRMTALRTNPDQTELRNYLIDTGVYRRAPRSK